MTSPAVTNLPFTDFQRYWRQVYKQSQHVTVIGPTGGGKTTLITELIQPRGYVTAFGVKHHDKTMQRLERQRSEPKWKRIQTWQARPRNATRLLLWPKVPDMDTVLETHRKVFKDAINSIYRIGGWTVWLDEMTYLTDHVGLRKLIRSAYILMRSNNVSLIGSAQRPAFVPLEAYSQASHLLMFQTGDERDLIRLGSINGASAKTVAAIVADLPPYTFLHVDARTRRLVTSSAPSPT